MTPPEWRAHYCLNSLFALVLLGCAAAFVIEFAKMVAR